MGTKKEIAKNGNIDELQTILFETIRGVRDGTVKLDEARCIAQTSAVLVESAKAEIKYLETTGATTEEVKFFPHRKKALPHG